MVFLFEQALFNKTQNYPVIFLFLCFNAMMGQANDIWGQSLLPDLMDYVIIAVYLTLLFIFALHKKNKKSELHPQYRFLTKALFAKILGAIALCLIYTLYYKGGGDTTGYYISSEAMVNLLFHEPNAYFKLLINGASRESFSLFSPETGYPWYLKDSNSFFVVRIASIFTFLGFKNYFTSAILFSAFFFIGYWKLFLLLCELYPRYDKAFFFAIFLFPSVLFWGSGISKDTVALSATGWFIHATFFLFVKRKKLFGNTLAFLISLGLLLAVKPYIFVALLPGTLIFTGWNYIKKIQNPIVRFFSAPLLSLVFIGAGILLLSSFKEQLGVYGDIDSIINKAIITYEDHSREQQYGSNFYSLGKFDGSLADFVSKAPEAIMAGLFKPYLWEVQNPVMLLAALENLVFMIFILYIFWRTGFVKTIRIAFDEPFVIFALSFALVFAFAVGISSANFGALVRLKIPFIPFLAAGLLVLYNKSMEIKDSKT